MVKKQIQISPQAILTLARMKRPVARSVQAAGMTATPKTPTSVTFAQPKVVIPDLSVPVTGVPAPEYQPLNRLWAIRSDDLFNGVFRFHNLHRSPFSNQAVRIDPDQNAHIALELPGQHFGEEVIQSDTFETPLRARLAGRSRIAVQMPASASGAPLTLDGLLGVLGGWPLSVDPLAKYAAGGTPKQMLQGAADTFSGLALRLFIHLAGLGLAGHATQAARLSHPLVQEAYDALEVANTPLSAQNAAVGVRRDVEEVSEAYAQAARNQISGDADAKREAGEAAESLIEVLFARDLAGRILDAGEEFGFELLFMSGLFNLMMHPHQPSEVSTALELPYRLITSPAWSSRFTHRASPDPQPMSGGSRVEMWRTKLAPRLGAFPEEGLNFYALWTPDYDLETDLLKDPDGDEVLRSLSADHRRKIVKRTTGHNEEPEGGAIGEHYRPVPAKVRKLELSPLGGTLNLVADWPEQAADYPGFGGLIGWRHQISLGRDERVRIAEAGVLYPMGVRCTKVTLTERLFRQSDGHRWAPLRQKVFLLIDDAPLIYPLDGQLNDGRAMPFRTLRCTTLKTPELDPDADNLPMNGQKVEVNGKAFLFEFAGTDDQKCEIGFKLPQYFLPAEYVTTWSTHRTALRNTWQAEGARYQARLAGQKMRLARGTTENLDMAVEKMSFTADHGDDNALFSPALRWAEARIPGVAEISGLADTPRRISLTPNFLQNSWPGDGRRIVVTIDNPIELDFGGGLTTDAMGAIGQVNQIIGAIADELGPIPLPSPGQLDQMIQGNTDWKDVLPQFKVLGKFLLEKLLGALSDHDVSLPTFRARREDEELIREWKLQEPITRSFDAAGVVIAPRDASAEIFLHAFVKVTLQKLVIDGEFEGQTSTLEIPEDLKDPAAEAHGHITNIDLTLFDLLKVRFDEIGFDAVAGSKPDGRVVMNADPMEFFGPLEFLNGLKDLIPSEGLGHGPMINPLPLGVEARFDMALPNVEIGVFTLKNMTLGAKTMIPFDERPIDLSFAFNERHRPFELAVAGFGGGGFFALSVDAGGVREIEAALEFGAQASMNLGVASGSVSIKGGVYFRYSSQDIVLEGYVELRGRLSVLEVITASLVFHMALAYEKRRDIGRAYVRGEATLRIEVEVLFFSTSVTLHVERSFEAGEADPKFAAMTGARDWSTHCNAFA